MTENNKKTFSPFLKGLSLTLILILSGLGAIKIIANTSNSSTEKAIARKLAKENENFKKLKFDLVDPELAPKGIHDAVLLGYNILIDTQKYAKDFVGNKLNCTNCHFSGGNTTGGENGSISLAAIASAYPCYNSRSEKVISLGERINSCFERSLNGKPLALGSQEMVALEAYLHWISRNYPIYAPIPWRGLKELRSEKTPSSSQGKLVYERTCALCHGKDGDGGTDIPPVFGERAYNDGAGMNNIDTLASFIHANMPYENPTLTVEEAFDVAAYIMEKPRPRFEKE